MKRIRRLLSIFVITIIIITTTPLAANAIDNDNTYLTNTNIESDINYDNVVINDSVQVKICAPNGRLHINGNGSLSIGTGASLIADDGRTFELERGATLTGMTVYKESEEPEHDYDSFESIDSSIWALVEDMDVLTFGYNESEGKWILCMPESSGERNITYSENTDITAQENFDNVTINASAAVVIKSPDGRLSINTSLTIAEGGSLTGESGHLLEICEGATVTGLSLYSGASDPAITIDATFWSENTELGNLEFEYTDSKWVYHASQDPQEPQEPQDPQSPHYNLRYDSNAIDVSLNEVDYQSHEGQDQEYPEAPSEGDDLVFAFTPRSVQQGDPENVLYGLLVRTDGVEQYIASSSLTSEGGTYTYTIAVNDFDHTIEMEAITRPTAFEQEFIFFYDNQNGAAVNYSIGGGNSESIASETSQTFTADTEYTFTLTPPDGPSNVYRVEKQLNGESPEEVPVTNNTFTWTPALVTDRCIFYVYWTEDQYHYDTLHAGEGEYEIEMAWFGFGSITLPEGTICATYNNQTKVVLNSNATSILVTMVPAPDGTPANEVIGVMLDNAEVASTGYAGNVYDLSLNGSYHRLEVSFTGNDNPGDPTDPPQNPKYKLRYQSEAVEITLNNEEFDNQNEGQDQNYPELTEGTDDLVFTFQAKSTSNPNDPPNEFYGLKITSEGENTEVNYMKAGSGNLLETGTDTGIYTFTLTESNFDKRVEIEVITWEMPFDNEFMIFFDSNNGASCNLSGSGSLSDGDVKPFSTNTNYTFNLTPPEGTDTPYRIYVEKNDGTSSNPTVNNNSFVLNMNEAIGFNIRIYWTEEQYNYDTLHADQDEFEVQFHWDGPGTVSHIGGNQATYSNTTKAVLSRGTANYDLTITPDTDCRVTEVSLDGQIVSSQEYASGIYQLHLSDNNVRVEISFDTQQSGGGTGDRDFDLKENLERRDFAYAIVNPSGSERDAIKEKFAAEIWETAFRGNTNNPFENLDELKNYISISASTTTGGTAEQNLSYYTYTVDINENSAPYDEYDIEGKIYRLSGERDFIVRATKDGVKTYQIVLNGGTDEPERAEVVMNFDPQGILVFGNGAEMVGSLGSNDHFVSAHVTNEHVPALTQFGRQLAVYNTDFIGASVTTEGETGYAAAWGFAQFPVATTTDTTQADPAEYEVFFGNTAVSLGCPESSDTTLNSVENVTTTLPSSAVRITSSGTGADRQFRIEFLSNFYDEIPVTITYETDNGNITEYLLIRRVGIDIQGYRQSGDHESDLQLNHGTDPGPTMTGFYDSNECGVYATYYYPTASASSTVELYVTKTWFAQNGSVQRVVRERIQTYTHHEAAGSMGGNSVALDDFTLYTGSIAECPDKIEVISMNTGSTSDSFQGANLGGGAGVEWLKSY